MTPFFIYRLLSTQTLMFGEDDLGEFQFGRVEGSLDYRIKSYREGERLEFFWEAQMKWIPVRGRG